MRESRAVHICAPIRLSTCLRDCLSMCLRVCVSACLRVCVFAFLRIFVPACHSTEFLSKCWVVRFSYNVDLEFKPHHWRYETPRTDMLNLAHAQLQPGCRDRDVEAVHNHWDIMCQTFECFANAPTHCGTKQNETNKLEVPALHWTNATNGTSKRKMRCINHCSWCSHPANEAWAI